MSAFGAKLRVDTSFEGNQATTKLILDADTGGAEVVLLEPPRNVSALEDTLVSVSNTGLR